MADHDANPDVEAARAKLVVAVAVGSLSEADVVRATLEGAGIPAFVDNENTSVGLSFLPDAIINPNGYQVRVRAGDLDAAREALEQGRQASIDLEPFAEPWPEGGDAGSQAPPKSTFIAVLTIAAIALLVVLLGLLLARRGLPM